MIYRQQRFAVTLLEVLVAIAIVGILIGLTVSAVQKVRARASQIACANNLRQIGLALHGAHAAHERLPPYPINPRVDAYMGLFGYSYQKISWHLFILPYVEQESLWRAVLAAAADEPDMRTGPHRPLMKLLVRVYGCPADSRVRTSHTDTSGQEASYTSYLGVTGSFMTRRDGVFRGRPGISLTDVSDGLSNTLMIGERPPSARMDAGWWYAAHPAPTGFEDFELPAENGLSAYDFECGGFVVPTPSGIELKYHFAPGSLQDNCSRYHFWSLHTGGGHFLFGDGSVRFLSYSARSILPALASRAGGEAVSPP
jgi:prepilin-type N-terminal cleavage/methylation domain-containing protein/prepilin-type processing-associated H-X9-DG protein